MSNESILPASVQTLILERIHSIEELEAILLLRSEPERLWSEQEVSAALRVPESATRSALQALAGNGLAHAQGAKFKYAAEHDQTVSELAATYERQRVETLVLISTNAIRRVRDGALRTFSEAFRLGGNKKKDG